MPQPAPPALPAHASSLGLSGPPAEAGQDPPAISRLLDESRRAEAALASRGAYANPLLTRDGSKGPRYDVMPVPNPAPVPGPSALQGDVAVPAPGMSRLVERSGYALQEEDEESRRRQAELASSLVQEGARSFFFGQDPPKQGFLQSPHTYAEDVLQQGSAFYSKLSDTDLYRARVDGKPVLRESQARSSRLSGGPAAVQASAHPSAHSPAAPAALRPEDVGKSAHRKIRDSVGIFRAITGLPVHRDSSIFSVAHRTFVAADFLTGDVVNSVQQADKEMAQALGYAREAYRASAADSRAGEYLLAAECSRLRQELQRAYQALEAQKQRALALLKGMDDRRLSELAQIEEKIKLTEKRREEEVSAALEKTKDYGEQVRTLRAMVEGIKKDQSVQEVDLLRAALAAEREKTADLVRENEGLVTQLNELQTEFSNFRLENADALNTISSLRMEVSRLEKAREYCKGCQDKIIDKARLGAADIQKRIQRVNELSQAMLVTHSGGQPVAQPRPGLSLGPLDPAQAKAQAKAQAEQERFAELQRKERGILDYFDQIRRAMRDPGGQGRAGEKSGEGAEAKAGAEARAGPASGSAPVAILNPVDAQTFPLDILPLARQLCIVEARMDVLPELQEQRGEIERLREEAAKLKTVERELADLRKIYRGVIARASASSALPSQRSMAGGSAAESSSMLAAKHQTIAEGGVTLLREQPLDLLVTKHFPIKVVDEALAGQQASENESVFDGDGDSAGDEGNGGANSANGVNGGADSLRPSDLASAASEARASASARLRGVPGSADSLSQPGSQNPQGSRLDPHLESRPKPHQTPATSLSVTPSYVAAIIQLFLRHLCMTAFTSETQFYAQLTGRILPRAEGTPVQCSYPVQALFTGFVYAQFHAQPEDRRRYLSELAINKVSAVLSAFQSISSGIFIEDSCMWLGLGALLLNASISGDELMFLIYLTVLAYGGLPEAPPSLIPDLAESPRVTPTYITMERAMNIISMTINKSIQRGFLDAFIQRGRATSLIRDMNYADALRASGPGGSVIGVYGRPQSEAGGERQSVDDLEVVEGTQQAEGGGEAGTVGAPGAPGAPRAGAGGSGGAANAARSSPRRQGGTSIVITAADSVSTIELRRRTSGGPQQSPSRSGSAGSSRGNSRAESRGGRDAQAPDTQPETVSVILLNYFLLSLLKAYRTELMSRLEATRVLYAGALLETSSLIKSEQLSAVPDSMRYRLVREVIRTLSPIASDSLVDAAYLDTIWRSPSANWSVLVDACKTRGVFSSALRFPPVEVIMGLVGGYRSQWAESRAGSRRAEAPALSPRRGRKPATASELASGLLTPTTVAKVRRLVDLVKTALLHLSAAMGTESAVATRAVVQEIASIDRATLSDDNIGVILNALRATLGYATDLALSVVCSSGRDFGVENESIRRSLQEGRGVSLVRAPRSPMEVCIDAMHYMAGALSAVLGWEVDLPACLESLTPRRQGGKVGR